MKSGPRLNMAGRIISFWVAVWLVISSIVVTIDALFVLLRYTYQGACELKLPTPRLIISWSSHEASRKHENIALKSTMTKQWSSLIR